MPTTTERVAIGTGAYVAVSNGHYNVFVRTLTPVALRLHVGQTLPPFGTTDYVPLTSTSISLSDLEGTDKVYLLAEGPGAEVVVIKGG